MKKDIFDFYHRLKKNFTLKAEDMPECEIEVVCHIDNNKVLFRTEKEIDEDWLTEGICEKAYKSENYHYYKINDKYFIDSDTGYPVIANSYSNFEFVDTLIKAKILRDSLINTRACEILDAKLFENEMNIINWYIKSIMSTPDPMINEPTIKVLRRITESMLIKSKSKAIFKKLVLDYFDHMSSTFKKIAKDRVEIRFREVYGGPF